MDNHPDHLARMKQLEHRKATDTDTNDCGLTTSSISIYDAAGQSTSFPLGVEAWYGDIIRIKKLAPKATIPTRANKADAGYDLYALEDADIPGGDRGVVSTGISMAIPKGYVGLIWPRSGLAVNNGVDVFAGVVDSGYRGEIKICLYNSSPSCSPLNIKAGDRVAQILFQEVENFELYETEELDTTDRGYGGFGSSGA